MKNKTQFENIKGIPNNIFSDFGKILYIYAWFYAIIRIIGFFILYIISNYSVAYTIYLFLIDISTLILLLLLVINANNVKIKIPHNAKINVFYTGLLLWLISYSILFIITVSGAFFSYSTLGIYILVALTAILPFIDLIFQIIAWSSLLSFFQNSNELVSSQIKRNGYISTVLLIIAAILQIINNSINYYVLYNIQNLYSIGILGFLSIILTILSFAATILFIVGYFVLSVNLKRKEMTIRGDYNYQQNVGALNTINNKQNENILNTNDFSTHQKKFCKYCGHPIEPFMAFCPECGKSLKY